MIGTRVKTRSTAEVAEHRRWAPPIVARPGQENLLS